MTDLILARTAVTESARTRLAHAATAGDLVRVVRGAYIASSTWSLLDAAGRYRMIVRAVAATAREPLIFCRAAAAVLWDVPWLGPWPQRVDVLVPQDSPLRSSKTLRRHREGASEIESIDGLRVTSLARTAIDVARESDFARAVVVGDAACARHADLVVEAGRVPMRHGSARARAVAAFADGRAASPGESVSRVTMYALGVPAPVLQQEFPRPDGGVWAVDFWWPDAGVIGEFDGDVKYLDPAFGRGRPAREIVAAEKRREDELRRMSRGFARWDWRVARSPRLLGERLAIAGLVPTRQRTRL
jgi:hypothetical protein